MEFPRSMPPNETKRAGRMLSAGRVSVSITSKRTQEHITVRFKCCKDNREGEGKNWPQVPFMEATHIFIDVPRPEGFGDKIGTFYPGSGKFYADRNADSARVWAASAIARWVSCGDDADVLRPILDRVEITEESRCGMCGAELTDPESIARGIGPHCFGKLTESQHQVKHKKEPEANVIARDKTHTDIEKIETEEGCTYSVAKQRYAARNDVLDNDDLYKINLPWAQGVLNTN
jgi:hypothetical protein